MKTTWINTNNIKQEKCNFFETGICTCFKEPQPAEWVDGDIGIFRKGKFIKVKPEDIFVKLEKLEAEHKAELEEIKTEILKEVLPSEYKSLSHEDGVKLLQNLLSIITKRK